jgi:hypothetical protein
MRDKVSFLVIGLSEQLVRHYRTVMIPGFSPVAETSRTAQAMVWHVLRAVVLLTLIVSFGVVDSIAGSVAESRHSDDGSGPIIQRIVVVSQNVFGAEEISKSRLLRAANRFHVPTRESVVLRESLMRVGDEFDAELALETERNLRELVFIYEADVTIDTLNPLGVTLMIRTVDRWSLSTGLKISRRSERNLFRIGLTESNLLGHGQRIGVTYTVFKPDPSYVEFGYSNPRIFGSFSEFGVDVVNNPFDRATRVGVRRRYLHQADIMSYGLSFSNFRQRDIDVTAIGDTAATYFQNGDKLDMVISARTGDYHRKLTGTLNYSYKNEQIQDLTTFNGYSLVGEGQLLPPASLTPADTFTLPEDSALHQLTFALDASRSDFYRETRIKYQRRVEDVTITNRVGIMYGQGRDRDFGGQLYSLWRVSANYGLRFSDVIVAGGVWRTSWIADGRELRSTLNSGLIAYFNRLSWVTFAGRGKFNFDKRIGDPNPLSIDGDSGVRGYPANFVTGNRMLVGNLESRLFTGVSALTARLGFALHFDFGAAWGDDDKLGLETIVWSAGPGLRIDMGQIGTIRLDVSYVNSLNRWEISAATGQFFDLNPGR